MKIVMLIFAGAALLLAQSGPVAKSQPQSSPAAQAARPTAVPKDAVAVEPYLYRYTDAQGKKWLYRQTPFGISKWEDKQVEQPVGAVASPVRITDLGDSYQFSSATPFGKGTWIRKKTELTEHEQELVKQDGKSSGKATEKQ